MLKTIVRFLKPKFGKKNDDNLGVSKVFAGKVDKWGEKQIKQMAKLRARLILM